VRVTRDQLTADALLFEVRPGDVLILQTDNPEQALAWADELTSATEKLPVPTLIVGPGTRVMVARQADVIDGARIHVHDHQLNDLRVLARRIATEVTRDAIEQHLSEDSPAAHLTRLPEQHP
jgi:hypothetical protein